MRNHVKRTKNNGTIMEFLDLSLKIKDIILRCLEAYSSGQLQIDGADLKAEHKADKQVYSELKSYFSLHDAPVKIFVESHPPIETQSKAEYCVFVDPIDGSINRDLIVGDPGIIVCYAKGMSPTFRDVYEGFVYGIHSGDTYFSKNGKAYYIQRGCTVAVKIWCDSHVKNLSDSILYYNDGYGKEFARTSFEKAGILPFLVKHRNAFDNSALEICQMSRGAAHLRVEARSYHAGGKCKGSDHANILPAYAIGKNAGLIISDLDGNSLDDEMIELDKVQDFICCSNSILHQQTLDVIRNNRKMISALFESIACKL